MKFLKKKSKNEPTFIVNCFTEYVSLKLNGFSKIFDVSLDEIAFYLGALTYPKEMIKAYADKNSKI